MAKVSVQVVRGVRINAWSVIRDAVERGLEFGWNRANKHAEVLPEPKDQEGMVNIEAAKDTINKEIMNALGEILLFDDEVEETRTSTEPEEMNTEELRP